MFDCHYLADEIKYIHNGCPLLKKDTVKLQLYRYNTGGKTAIIFSDSLSILNGDGLLFVCTRFTDTETHTEVFSLHVEILEPECSIIKLGPKSLKVPAFYSLTDVVDGNVVSFRYEKRSNLECSIHLSSQDTHLPAHGQLVTGELEKASKRGDEPESFIHLRQQLGNL